VLPAVELTVLPNSDLAAEHLGEPEVAEEETAEVIPETEKPGWGWREIGYLALGLLATLLVARRLSQWWAVGRQRREAHDLEEGQFERFQKAARSGDPGETYGALMSWLDRASPQGTTLTARAVFETFGDDDLARQYDSLEQALFGAAGQSTWDSASGADLAKSVDRARKRWLAGGGNGRGVEDPLPPLNPIGSSR
jgi:hypothetical protein